jgi:hypothetical protein
MLEILGSCWELLVGLGGSLWGIVSLVGVWGWDVLQHLHTTSPRLEGLLVGVALAWVMLRRDRHPLLRVLSAPLRLIVDILDLGWDQCVEVCSDLWDTARSWVMGSLGWVRDRVVGVYNRVMGLLRSVRDKLSRKKDD